ncbi:hypothetical protein AMJ50_02355 [Parcubacteria bacterium DG_74_3]|nr:MAG: hypothetical protein AMJ50_02355 [Parcubacteria bacterium DG_74_3]
MAKKISLPEEIYKKAPIHDLILFGIYSLVGNEKKCTFENLVYICFSLFPKAFCLSQHPKLPDSRKLDRPLRSLRRMKLIIGDPQSVFALTKQGRKKALEIASAFKQRKLL